MDASDLIRMLSTSHYAPADLEKVNDLCRNYPMFSLAHVLRVRIKEALGHDKESELKLAAIYAVDRKKLYELVTEVTPVVEVEEEPVQEEPEGIRFSDETNMEADVIIEQHAPYAGPAREGTLLELDEDADDEATDPGGGEDQERQAEEDQAEAREESPEEAQEELRSETLIEAVVKDEADLEDPDTEKVAPAIDVVEPENGEKDSDLTESEKNLGDSTDTGEEGETHSEPEDRSGNRDNQKAVDSGDPRELKNRLIRNFIMDDPGPIRADWGSGLKGDISLASIREHDGFITDTLAKIYVKQGLYAKAIYAYEKLSLKYPEKSAYFAAQIEKIRNINRS